MADAPDLPTTTEGEPLGASESVPDTDAWTDGLAPNHLAKLEFMSDEDFHAATKKIAAARQANARLLNELGQMGFTPEFTVSMLAMYFHGLVEVGLLTKAQLATIELKWEEGFYRQLQMMLKSGQEAIEQAQQRAKLLVPPSAAPGPNRQARRAAAKQGLILPGS